MSHDFIIVGSGAGGGPLVQRTIRQTFIFLGFRVNLEVMRSDILRRLLTHPIILHGPFSKDIQIIRLAGLR
jgi:hypothetical protein